MKYIKSFKIFESSSEDPEVELLILGTINDILLPISDSGTEFFIRSLENIGLIYIKILGQNDEINDSIKHLENYLKDLGHLYFIGRNIENETHISIENNFNQEIEKSFLEITEGVREEKHIDYPKSRLFVIGPDNYCIFNQDDDENNFYYEYYKIYRFFKSKHSLNSYEINETIRYLVGKHLKLQALKVSSLGLTFSKEGWII